MGTITVNLGSIAGKVSRSANLADLTDEAAARTNLGLGSAAQDAATDFATAAQGAKADNIVVPKGYIDGLQMQWVSGTAVTVSSGTAYIPSLGNVLVANAAMALTGLVPTASTWYHLYLYSNAGTPAVECVTTAPVLYYGTAYQKTGDNSRRYVGSVLADSTGNLIRFSHTQNGNILYKVSSNLAPYRQLTSAASGVRITLNYSSTLPVTSDSMLCRFSNPDPSASYWIGTTDDGQPDGIFLVPAGGLGVAFIVTTGQSITYMYTSTLAYGGAIDCLGCHFDR